MTTMSDIARKALQKSGVLFKSETPDADEANDAVSAINMMISSWSNDGLSVYARSWETFSITSGVNSYTIGSGGAFNTARPINIVSSYTRDGSNDEAVTIIPDQTYNNFIGTKTSSGRPYFLNYDNAYPLATIRIWPVPSTTYDLFLLTEKELPQYGINDTISLPPGWERALIYNGAIEVCSDYGQAPEPSVVKIAAESLASIKRAAARAKSMDCNPIYLGAGNFYTRCFL